MFSVRAATCERQTNVPVFLTLTLIPFPLTLTLEKISPYLDFLMQRNLSIFAFLLLPAILQAGEQPVGKLRSPVGTILRRGGDKGWLTPMLYDSVPAGAQLVTLPGSRGILDIKEGDVRLILAGNLPELSATPVLESVVTLQKPAAGRDLEFVLSRGRLLIENHKEKGAVKVRVQLQGQKLDFELLDNKSRVALELFSRWPAGAPFLKKPQADHTPVGEFIFMAVSGKVEIELNKDKQMLQAPGMYQFDTLRGVKGPLALKAAPAWVDSAEDQTDKVMSMQKAVEKMRRAIADQGVLKAIAQAQDSKEILPRELAAYYGCALDQPAAGIKALKDEKSKEVRAAGFTALHHFIGRGSAQDLDLYNTLVADKVKSGQAGIILELLHGLSDEARIRPETYDTLITYLQSDQIAIRELAALNLYALVPQGKDIAYDAGAPADQRARAQAAWRKLIPEGQVPKMP